MSTIISQLLLQVVFILVNAFFAATEIAVVSLNSAKLRKLEEEGDPKAPQLLKLVEAPSAFLSTIQIAITLAGFLGSAFAADNFSEYLVDWIHNGLGFTSIPLNVLDTISVVIVTLILAYFNLIFGELVPKRIAMQKSLEMAKLSCGVVSGIAKVVKPVIWFLSFSTNTVLRLLHMKVEAEEEKVTEEEIRMMLDLGGQSGTIDQEEQEWIENVFQFDDISVKEAMTITADIEAFSVEATDEEILQTFRYTGLSRFPVYDYDINDFVGILYTRDFLIDRMSEQHTDLKTLARSAYFVPDTIHADDLFQDMQKKKIHIAIVVDEYGQTAGIITIEDLLEEIVGNIYDEYDPVEAPDIEKLGDNLWRVTGSTYIEDLAEALDIELPDNEDYDTVGGMVFSCLNWIPEDGSQFDVQVNGLNIHVEEIEDRRIEKALIRKLPPEETKEDEKENKEKREKREDKENS